MFDSVLEKLAGRIDQRFLASLLLPCLLFSLAIGALVATDLGAERGIDWWSGLDSPRKVLTGAAAVATLLVLARFVGALLPLLVRLHEGYWGVGRLAQTCVRAGVFLEERRRQRLLSRVDASADAQRYYTLPRPGVPLLPTRLGNALRAAESYGSDPERYGMDTVFFWPRLFAILPEQLRASLGAARADLEQLIVVSTLTLIATVFAVVFGLIRNVPLTIWLPIAIACAFISRAANGGAVRAAIAFGDLVRAAVDLHRRSLLRAMDLRLPETLPEERALWKALGQQLFRRIADEPDLLRYGTGADKQSLVTPPQEIRPE